MRITNSIDNLDLFPKEYRIHVVLSQDNETFPVFWVRQDNRKVRGGIYCGTYIEGAGGEHITYHSDGKMHMKCMEKQIDLAKGPELKNIKGLLQVGSWGLNLRGISDFYSKTSVVRGLSDAEQIITLDHRYFEKNEVTISVFLIGKGYWPNLASISKMYINPRLYLFNILDPWILLVIGYRTYPHSSTAQKANSTLTGRIEYVTQKSSRQKIWVNFIPELSHDKLQILMPAWTFICKGKPCEMPEITVPYTEGGKLYISSWNGKDYYHWDEIGAEIEPFDPDGSVRPLVLWVESGVIKVLKHVAPL